VLAVINPVAGRGQAGQRWHRLRDRVQDQASELVEFRTGAPGDAERRAAAWISGGETGPIIVAGGDGTVHEVVNGIMAGGSPVPIAVMPWGTGNDFVGNAAAPADPLVLLTQLARPGRRADLGKLEFREPGGRRRRVYFVNSASVGVSPAANRYAQGLRRVLPGRLRYAAGGVCAVLAAPRPELVITGTGGSVTCRPLNLTLANGACFGGGMRIAPEASLYDGALDQVLIGEMSAVRALRALSRLYRGSHLGMPEVRVTRSSAPIVIQAREAPLDVEADGQAFRVDDDLTVSVEPAAVEVIGTG
jgi:diacylglycerol kinase family enzyme